MQKLQSVFFLLTKTERSNLCFQFSFQEYVFHLEPGKEDSGKGKCPYDPKLNSVSALISKSPQNGGKYIFPLQ